MINKAEFYIGSVRDRIWVSNVVQKIAGWNYLFQEDTIKVFKKMKYRKLKLELLF
jgi:hypothetical protein